MTASQRELMDSVDHAWLRMEGPNNLMMIGVVLIFDDKLDMVQLRSVLQTRLIDKYDRFEQVVVNDQGKDYWQLDPSFSLENHLVTVDFPAGGNKKDLQKSASQINSMALATDRPLWCIHHIESYKNGSALIFRIHHCIADGMALVRLIISLTDESPGEMPTDDNSSDLCMDKPTGGAGSNHHESLRDLIGHPSHIIDALKHGVSGAEELAAVTVRPSDPKTSLKGTLTGNKKVAWSDPFPLHDVKFIGKKLGATVNDVLMAAATGALRTHLMRAAEDVTGKTLHAAVPFNLRAVDADIEKLGNQFGLVIVPLPIGVEEPLKRLQAVKKGMDKIKHSYQAQVFFFLLQVLGKGPSVLEQTALDILSKKASLVMTNVPGPKKQLYLAGAKLNQPLAWVPQSGDIGVGLSILTYNDTVQFGLVADSALIDDLDEVAELFVAEFRKLEILINGELHVEPKGV